jgi:protein involved in polysaccharide export with SLBB domain
MMPKPDPVDLQLPAANRPDGRRHSRIVIALLLAVSSGCTALTNPTADGIPSRLVPPELLACPKCCMDPIPLSLLEQPQPDVYRLDTGDVLGVFIDGYVGDRTVLVPVQAPAQLQIPDQNRLPPGAGLPVPVQEDGKIALPSVPKLLVRGLTIGEAREAIRNLYIQKELIRADNERILLTLLYARQVEVLVFRQEALSLAVTPDGPAPTSKRNAGHLVDLHGYQNDVLHALVRSGGLPDLDAYNEIVVYRDRGHDPMHRHDVLRALEAGRPAEIHHLTTCDASVLRIPLRLPCGAPLPFHEGDIVLNNGDVIFLEARDEQVFYTAGLLPPGKWLLPRDMDLDAITAIAQVHGSLYNGAFSVSNLSGLLINPGIGDPSPSLLTVVRRVPCRGAVNIVVDLREQLRHPDQRFLIAPGDVLILQEKPCEAFARVFTQTIFNFDLFWTPIRSHWVTGTVDASAPDRIPGRLGSVAIVPP